MNEEDKNTIRSAVIYVLSELEAGKDFHGYDFLNACRRKLKQQGYVGRPYDETLLREFRRQKPFHKVYCVNSKKSIYHKGI